MLSGLFYIETNYLLSFSLFLFLSLISSMVAPVTQYVTKGTRNIINQKPIEIMVRKAKKPKYCVNSIFPDCLNSAPNIRRIFIFTNNC